MESLTTVSEIMSQLKLLTDGMAAIRQDVDGLKRASLLQPPTSSEVVDGGSADETADDSAPHPHQPLASNSSGLVPQDWADDMPDNRKLLLDDNDSTSGVSLINVVPVTDRTNKFLNEAFTSKMTSTERRKLRSHYTLPQNQLTRAPFLDAMMATECSRSVKATNRSLFTL